MSEVGSRKYTRAPKVYDPDKVLASNRVIDAAANGGLSTCCTRMLRVSSRGTYVGTRMRCTVCDRDAVVNDNGVWVRGDR